MTPNELRKEISNGNYDILYNAMLGTNGGSDLVEDQLVVEHLALEILNEEYAIDSWTPDELDEENWAWYCNWAGLEPWQVRRLFIVYDNTILIDVIVLDTDYTFSDK